MGFCGGLMRCGPCRYMWGRTLKMFAVLVNIHLFDVKLIRIILYLQ